MKKVAIITRTKDRPIFLRRCIESVANQEFSDYEHIIVNDGGDEETLSKAIRLLPENIQEKIKVFHRKAGGGPDTIFNESIDRSDSEYVAIHDDDDSWHPEFLKRTVDLLEKGAAGVVARTDRVYETLSKSSVRITKTKHYMPNLTVVSLYRQCIDNQLTPISFIYRRDAYEKIGKYDSSLPVVGDWEFGIRFLQAFDVEFLDPGFALANYHRRKNVNDDSFAKHNHRLYFTKVANKYLREDIAKGSLGIGYIISKLKYDKDEKLGIIKRIVPKTIIKRLRRG